MIMGTCDPLCSLAFMAGVSTPNALQGQGGNREWIKYFDIKKMNGNNCHKLENTTPLKGDIVIQFQQIVVR